MRIYFLSVNTIDALLDRAKTVLRVASDYALAKKLGVTQQAITNYRQGKAVPEPAISGRLAEVIGADPLEVIAIVELERENRRENPRPVVVDFWQRHSPRILPTLVAALVVGGVNPRHPFEHSGALPDIHSAYLRLRRWLAPGRRGKHPRHPRPEPLSPVAMPLRAR